MEILIGILSVIGLSTFFFYAALSSKHALEFSKLSYRTVYVTVGFWLLSFVLIGVSIFVFTQLSPV